MRLMLAWVGPEKQIGQLVAAGVFGNLLPEAMRIAAVADLLLFYVHVDRGVRHREG